MPSMYEIYDAHALEYDELLAFEDYEKNLPEAINSCYDFSGKQGYEFGVGTGRLAATYIDKATSLTCFDRSEHMMSKARDNLRAFSHKLDFDVCDNTDINTLSGQRDFLIEGWSFGHTVIDHEDSVVDFTSSLVSDCEKLVSSGGSIIFVETLGTFVQKPGLPEDHPLSIFYEVLEKEHDMARHVIRTDYRFPSVVEAERIMGFFFGESMRKAIADSNLTVIPEYTGIWTKTV